MTYRDLSELLPVKTILQNTRRRPETVSADEENTSDIKAPDDTEKIVEDKEIHKALLHCIDLSRT